MSLIYPVVGTIIVMYVKVIHMLQDAIYFLINKVVQIIMIFFKNLNVIGKMINVIKDKSNKLYYFKIRI